jgi:hypothetical protein
MMSMPSLRNLHETPLPGANDAPSVVAFACSPSWIASEQSADGKAALPKFSMVAYTGGPMRLMGWRHPVIVDLAGLAIPTQNRPIRLGHDAALGVGHTDRIAIEGGKIIAFGVVSRDTNAAREVVASSRNGFPWQASIGASVEEHEFVRESQVVQVNGQSFQGPVNVIRRSSLGEISFVDLGADGNTSALVATANSNLGDPLVNTSANTAPDAAEADTETKRTDVQASAVEEPSPQALASEIRAQALAETERINGIRTVCGSDHADIQAKAIREGWDTTRTELEILRTSRPKAPAMHVRDENLTAAVLEAACIEAGNLSAPEKAIDEKILDAAHRRYRGRMSLQRLIMEAAIANGCSVRFWDDDPSAVLRAAWGSGADVRAGLSSINLPGILSNVANKFLLDGFNSAESVWRNISRIAPVKDFKQITRYRLVGNMTYERVAPGGELKHGQLGEERFTNQADTYGKMISIDRRDLINDDLSVLTSMPQELGRGAAQSLNDIFWVEFLDDAAFFVAANKNILAGPESALSIDGLTKIEELFNAQVDGSGRPLGIAPAILLVPSGLNAIASALVNATEIRETTVNNKYPIFNPHQGKFRVEMSRYLNNPKIPGGAAKAWYLLANPSDIPLIEVVFLNGQESPTIENADVNFSTLGIQLRGYHDFGCKKQDPRAAVKALGL